jgi:choline dehydrogenase-like flavoprotein
MRARKGLVQVTYSSTGALSLAINPKYLAHTSDVEIMVRHVQFADKITKFEPLTSHVKLDGKRNPTAPTTGRFIVMNVVKEYVREIAVGVYHFTGTCSMMPKELGGVIDVRLRVHGCRNLRVCDDSIIPLITRTNVQGTLYGVAEHAAKMIPAGL